MILRVTSAIRGISRYLEHAPAATYTRCTQRTIKEIYEPRVNLISLIFAERKIIVTRALAAARLITIVIMPRIKGTFRTDLT